MNAHTKPPVPGTTTEDAEAMIANGWPVIPISGANKMPLWKWRVDKKPIPYTLESFLEVRGRRPDHISIGIPCGTVSGAAPVAVDFDIEDQHVDVLAKAKEAVVEAMGESLFERKGRKGTMLVYRNLTPIQKIRVEGIAPDGTKQAVEFLGDGQQFAAYGVHPKSRLPYQWPNDFMEPIYSKFEDVPEVTPEQIRAAAVAVEGVFRAAGFTFKTTADRKREASAAKGAPIYWDDLQAVVAAAGEACQDREKWLSYMGLKFAVALERETFERVGEEELFSLFVMWARGEFSAHGTPSEFVDAADCRATWDDTNEDDVGIGALINDAKAKGWKGETRVSLMDLQNDSESEPSHDAATVTPEITRPRSRYTGMMFNAAAPAVLKYGRSEFLIGGPSRPYLPAYGITNLLAKKRTGKTVLQLYTGAAVAFDTPWFGEPVMPGWYAIMQAGEVPELTLSHWLALLSSRGLEWPKRFIFSPVQDLTNPDDPDEFVWNVHNVMGVPKDARCLIMPDTFPRAVAGASQNDAEKMKAAVMMLEHTTRKLNGCALPSFHPNKTKADDISGAGELTNFTNGNWFLDKRGSAVEFSLRESRLRFDGTRKFYSIVNYSFSRPIEGDPENMDEGGVVTPEDGPQPRLRTKSTTDIAIEAIEDEWAAGRRITGAKALAVEVVTVANPGLKETDEKKYDPAVEAARAAIKRACKPGKPLHPYKVEDTFTVPAYLQAVARRNVEARKLDREAELDDEIPVD